MQRVRLGYASHLPSMRTGQICFAARGQTISIAFYPRKSIILYGSEQAAVKAGMQVDFPGNVDELDQSLGDVDDDALRLDLDGKLT